MFVVLAMVLRRKPDALITVLPTLRENTKYQGQDKLPVIVWMIAQVRHRCQNNDNLLAIPKKISYLTFKG